MSSSFAVAAFDWEAKGNFAGQDKKNHCAQNVFGWFFTKLESTKGLEKYEFLVPFPFRAIHVLANWISRGRFKMKACGEDKGKLESWKLKLADTTHKGLPFSICFSPCQDVLARFVHPVLFGRNCAAPFLVCFVEKEKKKTSKILINFTQEALNMDTISGKARWGGMSRRSWNPEWWSHTPGFWRTPRTGHLNPRKKNETGSMQNSKNMKTSIEYRSARNNVVLEFSSSEERGKIFSLLVRKKGFN